MCDRSSDPTEHDAARERPSALDMWDTDLTYAETTRLARAISQADHVNWPSRVVAEKIAGTVRAIAAARLAEPDAGEGTEHRPEWLNDVPTGYCECGADWTDAGCARSRATPTPDTTEATLPVPPYHDDRGDLQEAWMRGYRAALQRPAVQPEPTWQDLVMLCPKCADPTHLCDEHAAMKVAVQPEGGPE